jgi:hypothetical protein
MFRRYPQEPGVRPQSFAFALPPATPPAQKQTGALAFQSVPDKFYFLLFGAIRQQLRQSHTGRAELLVVRSVSGAVGTGWLAELRRSAPVAWLWSTPWERAYAGVMEGVACRSATWAHPWQDLRDWRRADILWRQWRAQPDDFRLVAQGVEVGDLVIDSYLRFCPAPRFDVRDRFVRRLIWQALRDVRQMQAYFADHCPALYLTPYTTYLEHGIAVRAALQAGVPVWSFGNLARFGKRLSLQDWFHTPAAAGYRRDFEALDRKAERLEQAESQLSLRLSGGVDAATSYMRQSAYGNTQALDPALYRGAVVVFLHDFYDSPHIYPDLVFPDFWQWACCTIEALEDASTMYYLKPHPNQIALSRVVLDELAQRYPRLRWLPSDVSNVQLARAGIACGVTVYGTVAHELAYLGIPTIGCARHPHHAFDFCRTARSRREYLALLQTPGTLPVPKDQMRRQALVFYYMHNLAGSPDERALCDAFVNFWRSCNTGDVTEEGVASGFRAIVEMPAFARFVQQLAR